MCLEMGGFPHPRYLFSLITPRERLEWMAFMKLRGEKMEEASGRSPSERADQGQLTDPDDIKRAMMAMSGVPR